MSMMCKNEACKAQKGMCGHEKMMMGILLLCAAGAVAHWCLHLV
jgi:hypothetical protein